MMLNYMKTVYKGRCKECRAVTHAYVTKDFRDQALVDHKKRTGHSQYRSWTEDQMMMGSRND